MEIDPFPFSKTLRALFRGEAWDGLVFWEMCPPVGSVDVDGESFLRYSGRDDVGGFAFSKTLRALFRGDKVAKLSAESGLDVGFACFAGDGGAFQLPLTVAPMDARRWTLRALLFCSAIRALTELAGSSVLIGNSSALRTLRIGGFVVACFVGDEVAPHCPFMGVPMDARRFTPRALLFCSAIRALTEFVGFSSLLGGASAPL